MNKLRAEIVWYGEDDLSQQIWEFIYADFAQVVLLESYRVETRKSKRHKWRVTHTYNRVNPPNYDAFTLTEEQVPWPLTVQEEALQKIVSQIKIARWRVDLGQR